MDAFAGQVRKYCHECGAPLRGVGANALDPYGFGQVSATHADIARPKWTDRKYALQVITSVDQLGGQLRSTVDYVGNAIRPKEQTPCAR